MRSWWGRFRYFRLHVATGDELILLVVFNRVGRGDPALGEERGQPLQRAVEALTSGLQTQRARLDVLQYLGKLPWGDALSLMEAVACL